MAQGSRLTAQGRPWNPRTRRYAILALVLTFVMSGIVWYLDPADRVTAGMSEAEVVQALGQPSSSFTDKKRIAFYVGDRDGCADKAARVLFYDRWLRLDVMVALGTDARVVCIHRGMVLTHVHS